MTAKIDRLPPQNLEAERGVLGSIFFRPDAFHEANEVGLTADHFYLDSHRRMFTAMQHLWAAESAVDAITVSDQLEKTGELSDIGGNDYLIEIIEGVPHAAHAAHYARIVVNMALLRRLTYIGSDLSRLGFDVMTDVDEAVASAEAELHRVLEHKAAGSATPLSEIALDVMTRIGTPQQVGLATGFEEFDELTHGLKPGQQIIVAARPGVGKSAFASNMALSVAKRGVGVLIFSLEMSKEDWYLRLLSAETRLHMGYLQSHHLSEVNLDKISLASSTLAHLPIFVDDHTPRTTTQIAAQARLHTRRHNVGLIVTDYLQLLSAAPEDRKANRETQVAGMSRDLKLLARGLGVPIVTLAQLNREVEKREGAKAKPRLSDLRESGAIEQDADVVVFLERPGMTDKAKATEASFIVAKHRNGPTRDIRMIWDGTTMQFLNPTRGQSQQFDQLDEAA